MVERLPKGKLVSSVKVFVSIEFNTHSFSSSHTQPEYYKDAPHFHSVVGSENKYWLEIPDAKLSYTGTYSVVATNCHGQTKAIISLQIFAKGSID